MAKSLSSAKGKLHPLKCDVSKEAEVKEAFQWVKKNLGAVDILVNNAGVVVFKNTLTGKCHELSNFFLKISTGNFIFKESFSSLM